MKSLIGRTIKYASINEDNDIVHLETDKGPMYIRWSGECCAQCFLCHISGAENLIDATITNVEEKEWIGHDLEFFDPEDRVDEFYYDQTIESMGTTITTTKGYVDFDTRLEHNGYYSGNINVTIEDPSRGYNTWKFLKDF